MSFGTIHRMRTIRFLPAIPLPLRVQTEANPHAPPSSGDVQLNYTELSAGDR